VFESIKRKPKGHSHRDVTPKQEALHFPSAQYLRPFIIYLDLRGKLLDVLSRGKMMYLRHKPRDNSAAG
jgi:hypothetical protein